MTCIPFDKGDYERGKEILEAAMERLAAAKGEQYRFAFATILALAQINEWFECNTNLDEWIDPSEKKHLIQCTEAAYRGICKLSGATVEELNKDRHEVMTMVHNSHS